MIEAVQLSKRFGPVVALDGVSLRVAAGEALCLLGANGAGKTTLLHVLLGFVRADSGAAAIDGIDVRHDIDAVRRRVGYVPEQVLLYDTLTGAEHVRLFAELTGQRPTDAEVAAALEAAGLDLAASHRRLETYSKGMRQKVALAMALSKRARVLLLDEPLSGLDPRAAIELTTQLKALQSQGLAILLTTHDLLRAAEVATSIAIMRGGRIEARLDAATTSVAALETHYLDVIAAPSRTDDGHHSARR